MGVQAYQNTSGSPGVEEVDTRPPFQSVKAAVSFFGEGAFVSEKHAVKRAKSPATENVLAKDTEVHLALNKVKEQLKNAEITKAQALAELQKAKKTAQELTHTLHLVAESKQMAIQTTENVMNRAEQLENGSSLNQQVDNDIGQHELDIKRENYVAAIGELDAAKQELSKLQQNFRNSLHAKFAAFQDAEEAPLSTDAHKEKDGKFLEELVSIQSSVAHLNDGCCMRTKQEHAKILSAKDVFQESSKLTLQETWTSSKSFVKEFDPELALKAKGKLAESTTEIRILQQGMEKTRLVDIESVKSVTTELDGAKETLQKVAEEETSLRNAVESLKQEIENVKKEHIELKEKEADLESVAGNLHVKLRKTKAEFEAAVAGGTKMAGASEELITTFEQMSTESMNAKREAELVTATVVELKKEAEGASVALAEAERKLQIALRTAEQSMDAEARALDQIKALSQKTTAARSCTSDRGAQVTITKEEYEALSRKPEDSTLLVEMKISAAVAQVEAVKASEKEALKRLELNQKEIEEMEAARKEASKRAEMAEAAKRAVEGELRRWREREHKRAAETASLILAETEVPLGTSPTRRGKALCSSEKNGIAKKTEKSPSSRRALLPNLSGIFQRKKSHLYGSPSYLPGEKPV